jgi:hypothetical protein
LLRSTSESGDAPSQANEIAAPALHELELCWREQLTHLRSLRRKVDASAG